MGHRQIGVIYRLTFKTRLNNILDLQVKNICYISRKYFYLNLSIYSSCAVCTLCIGCKINQYYYIHLEGLLKTIFIHGKKYYYFTNAGNSTAKKLAIKQGRAIHANKY